MTPKKTIWAFNRVLLGVSNLEEKTEKPVATPKDEGKKLASALRQRIRAEWSDLWDQRIEDRIAAEDVARRNYELLLVDRGTVIKATRGYRPPSLQEIFEKNEKLTGVTLTSTDPKEGGWGKFSREVLSKEPRWKRDSPRERREYKAEKLKNGPPKNGGRGWVHR